MDTAATGTATAEVVAGAQSKNLSPHLRRRPKPHPIPPAGSQRSCLSPALLRSKKFEKIFPPPSPAIFFRFAAHRRNEGFLQGHLGPELCPHEGDHSRCVTPDARTTPPCCEGRDQVRETRADFLQHPGPAARCVGEAEVLAHAVRVPQGPQRDLPRAVSR